MLPERQATASRDSREAVTLHGLTQAAGFFSMGVGAYERASPALHNVLVQFGSRSRFFPAASVLEVSRGFQGLRSAALGAGLAFAISTGLEAWRSFRNNETTGLGGLQAEYMVAGSLFAVAALTSSLVFRRSPVVQFALLVAGLAFDAAGLFISGMMAVRGEEGVSWGSFALQAAITYFFGWGDSRTRQAFASSLSGLGFRASTVGVAGAAGAAGAATAGTSRFGTLPATAVHFTTGGSVEVLAEGFPLSMVGVVQKAGGGFAPPQHLSRRTPESLQRQLEVPSEAGDTITLMEVPLAAVKARSPKLLTGSDSWTPGFRQVWDPRLRTTVVINVPDTVSDPRGVVVLFHGGSTEKSTPQSMLEPAQWFNEQGFLAVIPAQPFHEYGPKSPALMQVDEVMRWLQQVVRVAGDYYPEYRDLSRLLVGRSLGANELFEYAVRFGSGPSRDRNVAGMIAISPYAPAWSETCHGILGELDRAGITRRNPEGTTWIKALDGQWTFVRPKPGKAPVDPYPGGAEEDRFPAEAFRRLIETHSETSRFLADRVAGLEAEIGALTSHQPVVGGKSGQDVLGLRDRMVEGLKKTRDEWAAGAALLKQQERFRTRQALVQERLGYDIEDAWRERRLDVFRPIPPHPDADPSPTLLADTEIPILVTGGRLDQEYLAAARRHVEYWRGIAGAGESIQVVEFPFGYHNPFEMENDFTQATAAMFRKLAAEFVDRALPPPRVAAPATVKLEWALRVKHGIGPEVPSNPVLEKMITQGENVEWAALHRKRKPEIFRNTIRAMRTRQVPSAEAMSYRALSAWCDDVLIHEGRFFKVEDEPISAVLRTLLQIQENAEWSGPAVQTLVVHLRRHLRLEPMDAEIGGYKSFKTSAHPEGEIREVRVATVRDTFIHGLIQRGVPRPWDDPWVADRVRRLQARGVSLDRPPQEGPIDGETMQALLALVPTTLAQERLGLELKSGPKVPKVSP